MTEENTIPTEEKTFQKPRLLPEPQPQPCQHVKIVDCDKPVSRIFYECYHCKQGLLSESKGVPPLQDLEVTCPNCGKSALRLIANKVLSTTAIDSIWR